MGSSLLILVELFIVVVVPLLLLYLRSGWPLRAIIPCLLSIPVLWYFTYAPLHEISHVVATYLVGGTVTSVKLIPSFWRGEFGRAWITTAGVTEPWQQIVTTALPYLLDVVSLVLGIVVLRRGFSGNAFVVGFLFMLLCLRPAFDFVCEPVAFLLGDRGDIYHIAQAVGSITTWSFLLLSIGLSFFSIVTILRRFRGASTPVLVSAVCALLCLPGCSYTIVRDLEEEALQAEWAAIDSLTVAPDLSVFNIEYEFIPEQWFQSPPPRDENSPSAPARYVPPQVY
ncbi:hypothetical protein EHM92_00615 [bacterium]|nr:MAG: hypothetical protein EHM92_00615 [bacterium]